MFLDLTANPMKLNCIARLFFQSLNMLAHSLANSDSAHLSGPFRLIVFFPKVFRLRVPNSWVRDEGNHTRIFGPESQNPTPQE